MTLSINNNTVPTTQELQSYKIIAEIASTNQYWRKLGGNGTAESIVGTILSVMILARELGIPPMQAVSGGINNIQGRFEISARLMNQLIRRRGHMISIETSSDIMCIIWSKRKDTGEEHEERYTIEEAIRSGLVKEGSAWKKVPSDMLFARCISRMARRLYADCIGGCYVEGEIQESVQGKIIESIEVPKKDELDLICDKQEKEVKLFLPSDICEENVEIFINEISEQTKKPKRGIKKRASENMEAFLKVFKTWEQKRLSPEKIVEEAVSA
jgi:hypothetical protein